jgi:hypothetical protein
LSSSNPTTRAARPQSTTGRTRLLRLLVAVALGASFAGQAIPAAADIPADPTLAGPTDGATGVSTSAELSVEVSHQSGEDLDVTFYGREKGGGTGQPFSIVVLPDTQNYTTSDTAMAGLQSQVDWILAQRTALDIRAVIHNGDIQNNTGTQEWPRAVAALAPLQRADLPLAITPGNHDYNSILYDGGSGAAADTYDRSFPVGSAPASLQRFDWAGGYMGDPDDPVTADQVGSFTDRGWKNNYVLFSASGTDFIVISLEFNFPYETIEWLDAVLDQYPDRAAIINTHQWLEDNATATISTNGSSGGAAAAWNEIKDRCNVALIVSGHNHGTNNGETSRVEQNTCGDDVAMHLADYQSRPNGGNGWLRLLTFTPVDDTYTIETYSPFLDSYETDANSTFSHTLDMATVPAAWDGVGTTTVAGGSGPASIMWEGLENTTEYEWYVDVGHGGDITSTQNAPWSFTTRASPPATPSGLAASAAGATSLNLTWNAATGATSYELAVNGSTDEPIAVAGTSEVMSGLPTGVEVCLQVRAVNTDGTSDWSTPACGTPLAASDWLAYIDTSNASGSGTATNVLSFSSLPSSSVTTTLTRFSDGSAIDGVGVAFAVTGSLTRSTYGGDTDAGTDAAEEFGGIVDLAGVYAMGDGESLEMTFTGLDPNRTYTLATTANRKGGWWYGSRRTTFALQDANDFTNASTPGTTVSALGDETTFSTGNNTTTGYVARWTGIDPGTDGDIVLSSEHANGTSAYGVGAVTLVQEPLG